SRSCSSSPVSSTRLNSSRSGSRRSGSAIGGAASRSSRVAISSCFHSRRSSCQEPSASRAASSGSRMSVGRSRGRNPIGAVCRPLDALAGVAVADLVAIVQSDNRRLERSQKRQRPAQDEDAANQRVPPERQPQPGVQQQHEGNDQATEQEDKEDR